MQPSTFIPLSLYIHIPWCIKKCPYCDFNSHQPSKNSNNLINNQLNQDVEDNYINALILDLKESLLEVAPAAKLQDDVGAQLELSSRSLHSIFIGGGTPSLFSARGIETLLNKIHAILPIPDNTEITLEANPGTFESKKFKDFKLAGINRLSIGVQSFDNNCLKRLGRIHDSDQAKLAITAAKELGYNLNIDLMHSLPEQSLKLALTDLELATTFEPNHLSWYQLTIEPNTKFAKQPPVLPSPEILDDIYYQGLEYLTNRNYKQYEISAYEYIGNKDKVQKIQNSQNSNNKSQHNLNYWRYGDYIGIGAGAHSKLSNYIKPNNHHCSQILNIKRIWKQKSPIRYLDNKIPKISGHSDLTQSEVLLEFMMNKLRVLEPITEKELMLHTNYNFSDIKQKINQAIDHNWLIFQKNSLATTDLGRMFLNDLILLFA